MFRKTATLPSSGHLYIDILCLLSDVLLHIVNLWSGGHRQDVSSIAVTCLWNVSRNLTH